MAVTLPIIVTKDIIGLPVAVTSYAGAIQWIKTAAIMADRAYAVEAANTHVAALARHDSTFGEAMSRFDLICPDGMPLLWSVNRKVSEKEKLTDRVYGPTLMLKTIEATEGKGEYRHFFLGGQQTTLDKLNTRFAQEFPRTSIVGSYSPPFGDWTDNEFERICQKIKATNANLIWVGLGCPKQERWIAKHKDELPLGVYFGIGAAFTFHAGEVKQAPIWIQKSGLEWFYRICKEPRRLYKRYLTYNSLYIWYNIFDRQKKSAI